MSPMRTPTSGRAATCFGALVWAAMSIGTVGMMGQSTTVKPAANVEPSSSLSFSIETEMLTYRALESNSEAIACDIAGYLYGTTANFKSPPAGSVCSVAVSGSVPGGVVILPFDHGVVEGFSNWRADMQTMEEIESRVVCPAAKAADLPGAPEVNTKRGLSTTPSSSFNPLVAMTPAGPAAAAAAGVLGLFASDRTSSSVGGTVQDQAFMDGVGRELRAAKIAVLMPSAYSAYGLTSFDPAKSPFLVAYAKLQRLHDCLSLRDKENLNIKLIEQFLAKLASGTLPTVVNKPAAASGTASALATTQTTAATAEPQAFQLQDILAADALAQRLGADPATGKIPESAPQHVLLIKALESGGSINKFTNIFGTKISYSGGSVGSYALFDLDGDLECSGNVFDYSGPIPFKSFMTKARALTINPSSQVIFQRGTCRR